MGVNTAPERPVAVVGETNTFSVSFTSILDGSELLTGTPDVVEVTSTDLTIVNFTPTSDKGTVSTTALTINNVTVPIGEAVQFKVTGHLAATAEYTIKITAGTDATPAQTKVRKIIFKAEA